MSKKIAEGIDALVLDVKCGRGAFMKTAGDARQLAAWLVGIGERSGVRTEALITRDGRAARPRRRQCGRSHRVDRDAEGARARRTWRICPCDWRRGWWCWRASRGD